MQQTCGDRKRQAFPGQNRMIRDENMKKQSERVNKVWTTPPLHPGFVPERESEAEDNVVTVPSAPPE